MFRFADKFFVPMIWLGLIGILPIGAQGDAPKLNNTVGTTYVQEGGDTFTQDDLTKQRKMIEETKLLFAKIDTLITEITKIQRHIERNINNQDGVVACLTVEQAKHFVDEVSAQVSMTGNAADKAKALKKLEQAHAIFAKAQAATTTFHCQEE